MNAIFEMWEPYMDFVSVPEKEKPTKRGAFEYLEDNWEVIVVSLYGVPYKKVHEYVLYSVLSDFYIPHKEEKRIIAFLNSKMFFSNFLLGFLLFILCIPIYVSVLIAFYSG